MGIFILSYSQGNDIDAFQDALNINFLVGNLLFYIKIRK